MKLQKKTSLVLIPLSVVMCILGYLFMVIFIIPVFSDWALNNTYKNTNLAIDILEYDFALLSTVVKDYAEWTELYEYVEVESEDFIESNVDLDSLGYDIGFIVNKNREVIYCATRNQVGEIANYINNKKKNNEYFERFINEYASGFIEFNGDYYMFATSPITDSTKNFPVNGYMFFGKKFDEENNVVLWNKFFDLKINLLTTSDYKINRKEDENLNVYKDTYYSIKQINYNKVESCIKLLDIEGVNFSNVEIVTITNFLNEGLKGALKYYLVMMVCFIIFVFIIMRYLIKAEVLEPIDKIIKKIEKSNIYLKGDIVKPTHIGVKSELALLESEIDNYIVSIYNHHNEILELNSSLEEKIIERTKELSDLNERLETQAYYDSLTGIPNRAFFYNKINMVFNRVMRSSNNAALLYMDLDGFKSINDTYGHDIGDEVLIQFANRIKERIRITDFFARMGGDEFTIIIEDVKSVHEISLLIDMIIKIICKDIIIGDVIIKLGVSVGYAMIDNTYNNVYDIIKLADKEMYKKKQEGKCN